MAASAGAGGRAIEKVRASDGGAFVVNPRAAGSFRITATGAIRRGEEWVAVTGRALAADLRRSDPWANRESLPIHMHAEAEPPGKHRDHLGAPISR